MVIEPTPYRNILIIILAVSQYICDRDKSVYDQDGTQSTKHKVLIKEMNTSDTTPD